MRIFLIQRESLEQKAQPQGKGDLGRREILETARDVTSGLHR